MASFLYGTTCRIARRLRAQKARQQLLQRRAAHERPETTTATTDESETHALLHAELNRLPRKYRDALVLCYLQSKTNEQAARELGYPPGSMSRHLSRARELLRERLRIRGVGVVAAFVSAAVSPELAQATVQTVRRHALASALLTSSTSSAAVLLARGALRSAWVTRLTLATALLMVGAALACGVTAFQVPHPQQAPQPEAKTPPRAKPAEAQPRRDLYGDPLPEGVLARMGTERLRHAGAVGLAFAEDGKTLISAGRDQVIRFWDRATGQLKRVQRVPQQQTILALSPDGKTLVVAREEQLHLWDIAAAKEVQSLEAAKLDDNRSYGHSLAISPDGNTLAGAFRTEGRIQVWDTKSGKQRGRFKMDNVPKLTLSPDGKILAASGRERLVLWDVPTGKELHAFTGANVSCDSLRFSPDGKTLAGGNPLAVMLWDTATGQESVIMRLKRISGPSNADVTFAPDGKILAVRHQDQVTFWDCALRKEVKKLKGPLVTSHDPYTQFFFSADGTMLASLRLGVIVVWDVATGRPVQERPSHHGTVVAVAFSPDGKWLASACGGDRSVRLWDAHTGQPLFAWSMPHVYIEQVLFTPDGANVIAKGIRGECRMWDTHSGKERHVFRVPALATEQESEMITAIHLSPDGKRLTALSLRDNGKEQPQRYLTTWDVPSGEQIERRRLALDSPRYLLGMEVFSPDGKWVTAASGGLMLYDVRADRPLPRRLQLALYPAFSPDSKLIACGGRESLVQLMDLATGSNRLSLFVGEDVHLRSFSRDGRYMLLEGQMNLRLWELASGKQVLHYPGAGTISLALSPDGRSAATGLTDSTVLIWDLASASRQKIELSAADRERLWNELAGEDAPRAYRAIGTLIADHQRSVPFLREHLQPVKEDAPRIRRLIADLDSEQFAVRDAAWKELEKMDDAAHGVLRQALKDAKSLELRRRLETLLSDPFVVQSPRKLRQLRAIAVLEQIGNVEARRILEHLATGATEARQTREANAALARLSK